MLINTLTKRLFFLIIIIHDKHDKQVTNVCVHLSDYKY